MNTEINLEKLKRLREPFQPNQISKLPKPTTAQTNAVKSDYKAGIRCKECGAWHHPQVIHLDYVGHAALTDRLLEVDPTWSWEPLAYDTNGLPLFDKAGGMWGKLTICGVTRIGYGHAEGKQGGDAIKEIIGDFLRNSAMRFGAALDLWHKGDLHDDEPDDKPEDKAPPKPDNKTTGSPVFQDTLSKILNSESADFSWIEVKSLTKEQRIEIQSTCHKRRLELIERCKDKEQLNNIMQSIPDQLKAHYQEAFELKLDLLRDVA